jgi:hypothetical protein
MVKYAYSHIGKIARVAHSTLARKKFLLMIAYFDESGKPESKPIVSMSALVSTELKWRRFEVSWRKILRSFGAPVDETFNLPYFHMTDYESPNAAPYKDWKKCKRIEFASKLSSLIKRDIMFGCVHSMAVADWNKTIGPHIPTQFRKNQGWYMFLFQSCLQEIDRRVPVMRHDDIACVLDTNAEAEPAARDFYEHLKRFKKWEQRFGSITYGNSVKLCPLQAADMVAFEGRRRTYHHVIEQNGRPVSKLLISLAEKNQIDVSSYSRKKLLEYDHDWRRLLDGLEL